MMSRFGTPEKIRVFTKCNSQLAKTRVRDHVRGMLGNSIEIEMNDPRLAKAMELRVLAMDFREKAEEMRLIKYIDLMLRSATELERVAEDLERMSDDNFMSPVAGRC